MTSFDDYAKVSYPKFLKEARTVVDHSPVAIAFERLVLRVMQLLEEGLLDIPSDASGETFRLLAIKGVSESRGFLACARDGNMWSAFHHSRALIELLLSSHHLLCKPAKRDKRMSRFQEFPALYTYHHHLRTRQVVAEGLLTEDEYEQTRLLSDEIIQRLESKQGEWRKLFRLEEKKTLPDISHWHHPSSIADLLREFHLVKLPLRLEVADLRGLDKTYAHYCHATHVSPSGHRLFSRGWNLPMVSVQLNPQRFMDDVVLAAEMFVTAMALWGEYLVPEAGLLRRSREWLEAYRQRIIVNA